MSESGLQRDRWLIAALVVSTIVSALYLGELRGEVKGQDERISDQAAAFSEMLQTQSDWHSERLREAKEEVSQVKAYQVLLVGRMKEHGIHLPEPPPP